MMRRRISRFAAWGLALSAALSITFAYTAPSAAAFDFFGGVCTGAGSDSAACNKAGQKNITGTQGVILRAASLLAIIASVAAVIVILIAGMMFITAGGDSSKISSAKNTITYTVVGLIVIFLARAIVIFVVNRV